MEIPDLLKYKDKFTKKNFSEKIQRIAKRAGVKFIYSALILYYSLDSNKLSLKDKALIIGALGYLISPLDIMPDAIPIAGLSDDLAVLLFLLQKIWNDVDQEAKDKAHAKLSQWFDIDEIKVTEENLFDNDTTQTPV